VKAWRVAERGRSPSAAPGTAKPALKAKPLRAPKLTERPTEIGATLITAVKRLANPFTNEAIMAETGAASAQASNFLQRAKAKGWVRKVGRGLWERTAQFANQDAGGRSNGAQMLADIHREIDAAKPGKD
jgi:hypothetical protein